MQLFNPFTLKSTAMKKFTFLFAALLFIVGGLLAQNVIPGPEFIPNSPNSSARLNLPYQSFRPLQYFRSQDRLLKSTPTIKLDSIVTYSKSDESQSWKTNVQTFEYDDDYLRLAKIKSTSGVYSWLNWPETVEFSYNDEGMVESIHIFNQYENEWGETFYFSFTYDENGRMLTAYSYYPWDGAWEINVGKNYKYDAAGNVSEIFVEENWWAYWTTLHKYTYDTEGKLISYKEGYMYKILATYEWNKFGNLAAEHYRDWYQKREQNYEYDTNGNRVKSTLNYATKDWNSEVWTTQKISSETYTYTEMNSEDLVNIDLSLLYLGNELDEVPYLPKKLLSTVEYRVNSGSNADNSNVKESFYFYSTFPDTQNLKTGLDDKLIPEFAVFPNPATDQITFSWPSVSEQLNLKIIQLTGACVTNRQIRSKETISLEDLPMGIYIYQISDKQQLLKAGKLVVE
jgi:hypothetical protein